MTKLISVPTPFPHNTTEYCSQLEEGNILFFPCLPFEFPQEEIDFLLAQRQTEASHRKNIAYKPNLDRLSNFVRSSVEQEATLHHIMRSYSERVRSLLANLLSPYATHWTIDYASFRPFQEKGRALRIRARNDLLHVDAFPSRPTKGKRILRFFTNINPLESRKWITSEPFPTLAREFGGSSISLPHAKSSKALHFFRQAAIRLGIPLPDRSPYDTFMLQLHNFLKENSTFQATCHKNHWEFPPNSCWIVYTDLVSHAAISGQYALEQTFLIPPSCMVHPEKAPVHVLEKLGHKNP